MNLQLVIRLLNRVRASLTSEQFSYNTTAVERRCPMAMQASTLPREVFYNGSRIPDPNPKMQIDQVRELLTPSYPEIATATMTGPEDTGACATPSPEPSVRKVKVMPRSEMTREDLVAIFAMKATAPPPEA